MVIELNYSNTNTYLIKGTNGYVLFDTGWAGSFNKFCKEIKKKNVSINDIKYILISHFHPDHMGIAQDIANLGPQIVVFDVQKEYIHNSDEVFSKEGKYDFTVIDDEKLLFATTEEGQNILSSVGISGEIIPTPGHSDDSISLLLESGEVLVGDLNPVYELELHKGSIIYDSWKKLFDKKADIVYYGHAKSAKLTYATKKEYEKAELYLLVSNIMKYIDKGKNTEYICRKTKADKEFVEDVTRMYLTHQDVGVLGILDRIEIKGK